MRKRYTAQKMREIEQLINSDDSDRDLFVCNNTKSRFEMEHIFDYNEEATLKVKAMLRQAADAEEENAKLRVDADIYKGAAENWERRAKAAESRLNAVVKECEIAKWNPTDWIDRATPIGKHNSAIYDIIRVARGDARKAEK